MSKNVQHQTDAVTVRWLGVAGVEIAWGGRSLLIDPYFSRLSLHRLLAGRPQPDTVRIAAAFRNLTAEPAAIAITHTHIDHALDVPVLAQCTKAQFFGNSGVNALLARAGHPQRATVCHPGDRYDIPGMGCLNVFAGSHGRFLFGRPPLPGHIHLDEGYPLFAREFRGGDVLVFDITVHNLRIIHVGSAGVPAGVTPEGACDILFLCVPGWQADANYPGAFLTRLRPHVIVPIHMDRMTCPVDDPRAEHPGMLTARGLDLPGFLTHLARLAPDVPVRLPHLLVPDLLHAVHGEIRT